MAICGDGGFMMNAQELETAVRLKMNLICLILRDDSYGMIRWKQANMGFEDFGLEFENPDFVKFAECRAQIALVLPLLRLECRGNELGQLDLVVVRLVQGLEDLLDGILLYPWM